MTNPRLVTVVAAVLVVVLVLAGGLVAGLAVLGGAGADPVTESPVAVATRTASSAPGDGEARTPPEEALAPFYDQDLAWEACPQEGGSECATLTVPVDYAEPGAGSIEVALLRVPATGESTGSLVVNPGGPGAPGTGYAAAAPRVFGPDVTATLDVVGFDPRGTGGSDPVDCLSDAELDAYLAQDPDPDTTAEAEEFQSSQEGFFAGCVDRSDDLLAHVTTIETARDMDVLRAALEEPALAYFGASYGTKLGATYAELFPDRVGRFVLDGAVDVSLSSRELSLGQAEGFEVALRAYVENCVETVPECFLGDSVEAGLERITTLVEEADSDPLPTGGDRALTEGLAFYGIVTPLYNRDYWPLLDQALRTAFAGDGTSLLLLADLYASRDGGTYTDNSAEAIYAINCLDDPAAITADEVGERCPRSRRSHPRSAGSSPGAWSAARASRSPPRSPSWTSTDPARRPS